jgi:hypothetical protein
MTTVNMCESRLERIARGVFRAMGCTMSDDEVRRVVRRVMRFVECRQEIRRAA